MATVTVKINEKEQAILVTLLEKIPPEATGGMVKVLNSTALDIAREARKRAPRGPTGDLKKSIKRRKKATVKKLRAVINSSAFYAHFVEFGTQHSPAKAFMVPAVESHKRAFEQGAEKLLERVVK